MSNFISLSLIVLAFAVVSQAYTIQPRIIDGEKAKSGQFPYYAYLSVQSLDPRKGSACGASLLNDEWLVTAAHCLQNARSVDVHLGEYHLKKRTPGHKSFKIERDEFHPHPEYKHNMALNDIGKCSCRFTLKNQPKT